MRGDLPPVRRPRPRAAYREALAEFNTLQRSVLDVAQQSGLVDPSARKLWESEFYVPFYRVMEDDATGTMGPGQIGGLVGQSAYKRLKGGTDKLGDLVANTVSNWSHLLSASMKNLAAQARCRKRKSWASPRACARPSAAACAPCSTARSATTWLTIRWS